MQVEDGRDISPQLWGHVQPLQQQIGGTFHVFKCQIAAGLSTKNALHLDDPSIQLEKKNIMVIIAQPQRILKTSCSHF